MKLGAEVTVRGLGSGRIAYVGRIYGCVEERIGVILDERHLMGNDGTFNGRRYFWCQQGKGTFAKRQDILPFVRVPNVPEVDKAMDIDAESNNELQSSWTASNSHRKTFPSNKVWACKASDLQKPSPANLNIGLKDMDIFSKSPNINQRKSPWTVPNPRERKENIRPTSPKALKLPLVQSFPKSSQVEEDMRLARELQEQFDREERAGNEDEAKSRYISEDEKLARQLSQELNSGAGGLQRSEPAIKRPRDWSSYSTPERSTKKSKQSTIDEDLALARKLQAEWSRPLSSAQYHSNQAFSQFGNDLPRWNSPGGDLESTNLERRSPNGRLYNNYMSSYGNSSVHPNVTPMEDISGFPPRSSYPPEVPSQFNPYERFGDHSIVRMDDSKIAENVLSGLKVKENMRELDLPDGFVRGFKMYPHQAKGVWWMIQQEKNLEWKGGLLCDQMGLGKTIQGIALLLSERNPVGRPNLIVAPLALATQWKEEINEKAPGQFSVYIYHGANRSKSVPFLRSRDIVITTYSIISCEHPNPKKYPNKPKGCLYGISFYRIILDEAHFIKNTGTNMSKGAVELRAEKRWCFTGTPIQNKLKDLYAYCLFLRLKPYNVRSRFNEMTASIRNRGDKRKLQALLQAVLLRRLKKDVLTNLVKKEIYLVEDDFSKEERDFYEAVERKEQTKFNKFLKAGTVMRNYSNVLAMLMRLRQAANHPHLMKWVRESQKQSSKEEKSESEEDGFQYDPKCMNMLVTDMGFGKNRAQHALFFAKNNYQNAVSWLLDNIDNEIYDRPRMSGKDVLRGKNPDLVKRLQTTGLEDLLEQECPMCFDLLEVDAALMTRCGHFFCKPCLEELIEVDRNSKCPSCRQSFTLEGSSKMLDVIKSPSLSFDLDQFEKRLSRPEQDLKPPKLEDEGDWGDLVPSTKILRLMKTLEESRRLDKGSKTIVFSQFTSMLDLVGPFLTKRGIKYLVYDGRISRQRKDYTIKQFKDPRAGYTVMLMSLRCGSVGLNLTSANRVIFLDLWWNPSVEEQATDRVHRIGQTKPVVVHRLTIKDTVEGRILQLQETKKEIARSALSGNMKASRLSVTDLKQLFGIP